VSLHPSLGGQDLCDNCGVQLLPEEDEFCDVCFDEAHEFNSSDVDYRGTIYYTWPDEMHS